MCVCGGGGIQIYICPSFRPSFRPPVRNSVTLFVKDISRTISDKMFIFGIQVDIDKLYRGIENWHPPVYSSLYLSIFFSLHLSSKISPQLFMDRKFIFGIRNKNGKLYCRIDNRICPVRSSFIFIFSFSPCNQYCIFSY